jgi:hypothetical protein
VYGYGFCHYGATELEVAMSRPRTMNERLAIVLPVHQKAEVIALANREEISIGTLVRRALKRELRHTEAA